MLKEQAIHRNLRERSDATSIFERGGKSFIFVAGPAIVLLIIGWLIGIPFFK